ERLSNAVKALIEAADKSDLESLIKKAEAIDESKYTSESLDNLNKALSAAHDVMVNNNIAVTEQGIVNEAVKSLSDAIEGLKLKGSHPGNNGNGAGNGNEEDDKNQEDTTTNSNNTNNGGSNNGNVNNGSESGKGNSNLPSTGGNSPIVLGAIGILIIAAGIFVFKKKKTQV
ncbi:LPXTG cell wall anchor domain-containing protein, partial [Clostridium sp.]